MVSHNYARMPQRRTDVVPEDWRRRWLLISNRASIDRGYFKPVCQTLNRVISIPAKVKPIMKPVPSVASRSGHTQCRMSTCKPPSFKKKTTSTRKYNDEGLCSWTTSLHNILSPGPTLKIMVPKMTWNFLLRPLSLSCAQAVTNIWSIRHLQLH